MGKRGGKKSSKGGGKSKRTAGNNNDDDDDNNNNKRKDNTGSKQQQQQQQQRQHQKKNGKGGKNKHNNKYNNNNDEDIQFRISLEENGKYTIIEMDADGNCLFRSLSDQLFYDYGKQHDIVRHGVCNYIQQHKDEFIVFLVLDDPDCKNNNNDEGEDATDFESYVSTMRQDGEWGGNIELVAAAKLYRRNITVFSANLSALNICHGEKKSSGPDLLLSYHDNDHYSSVRDNTIIKKSIKPIKAATATTTTTTACNNDDTMNDSNLQQQDHQDEQELNSHHHQSSTATTTPSRKVNKNKKSRDKNKGPVALVEEEEEMTSSTLGTLIQEDQSSSEGNDDEQEKEKGKKTLPPSSLSSTTTCSNITPPVTVKKSSPCPCGSGKKYRKCCWRQEKHYQIPNINKMKMQSTSSSSNGNNVVSSTTIQESDHETFEMNGNFRVLQI